ncbi:serine protease [Rhodococcus hoagii]|nr:serine protease [Prescottella equi]NKZ84523.1 serine protease [Prescottella equi]
MKRALIAVFGVLAVLFTLSPTAGAQEAPDTRVVLHPGDGISYAASETLGWCSVAAIGRDNQNRLVAITAGHCRASGTNKVWKMGEVARGPIGKETDVFSPGSMDWLGITPDDRKPDYAVLLLDETKVRGSNTSADGSIVLNGIGYFNGPGVGSVGELCHQGYSSKTTYCDSGSIAVLNNLVHSNSVTKAKAGDSGGVVARSSDGLWMGLAVGLRIDPLIPGVFQRADVIVNELNKKGSYGAGFTVVTTP